MREQLRSDRRQQWLRRHHPVYGLREQRSMHGLTGLDVHLCSDQHGLGVRGQVRPGGQRLRRHIHMRDMHRAADLQLVESLRLHARADGYGVRRKELRHGGERLRRHIHMRDVRGTAGVRKLERLWVHTRQHGRLRGEGVWSRNEQLRAVDHVPEYLRVAEHVWRRHGRCERMWMHTRQYDRLRGESVWSRDEQLPTVDHVPEYLHGAGDVQHCDERMRLHPDVDVDGMRHDAVRHGTQRL